ncbi:AraC family transcriptional regulator [Sphingobacteriaceae bacterium]|nr:AraC family transcriptional regulator [Sphingobacteriaceae bacterium]
MIHQIKTIEQFYKLRNLPAPANPLIGLIDVAKVPKYRQIESGNVVFGFYVISFKRGHATKPKRGQRIKYFAKGVLGFRAPGQVVKVEPDKTAISSMSGWMLCIHPDFLLHTPLAKKIRSYDFFYNDLKEPLFLSEEEQFLIHTLVLNISREFQKISDKLSKKISIALIDALLAYIERFYQTQFNTDSVASHTLLDKLYNQLNKHFDSEKLYKSGLPTVSMFADKLNVSPHYLSAALRAITGKNAQQHIHEKLISKAKELLSTTELSVSEIAYALGFEHLQSFSKLFKAKTKLTPLQFKRSFN